MTKFQIFWLGMIETARAHNLPEPTYGPARLAYQAMVVEGGHRLLEAA